jgi:hypothetical protein
MRAAHVSLLVCAAALATTSLASAQSGKTYKARLSPVPIDATMQATVAGSGSISAVLAGTKLVVTGSFEGLRSPATIAMIHKSPIRGVRGPELLSLTVSPTTSGTISGTVDLTPAQVTDLEKGRLYIQLHSEKAPDGNLWGWLLLPQEKR